jgi:hypothetical protein
MVRSEGFLCVSSLKERGRSTGLEKWISGCEAVASLEVGGCQPADGVNGEDPQRSEDGQSWAVKGWGRRRPRVSGWLSCWASSGESGVGDSSIASNRWLRAARGARVPVIPSPGHGGMELYGRSQAGSIKRATTPPERGS